MTVPFSDFSVSSPVRPFVRLYEGIGKRLLDLMLVLLAAPVAVPLVGLILLATWREGGRPLYMQHRIGRGGQLFRCWKVRTMVQDEDGVLSQLIGSDPARLLESVRERLMPLPDETVVLPGHNYRDVLFTTIGMPETGTERSVNVTVKFPTFISPFTR